MATMEISLNQSTAASILTPAPAGSTVIVLAADFSDPGSYPVQFAEALAAHQNARLVLTHIVDPALCMPLLQDAASSPEELPETRAEILLLDNGAPGHIHDATARDRLFEALESSVLHHQPALLVLGTRAHSLPARAVLGAVARKLVRHCSCPVLIVGPPDAAQLAHVGQWRRILAATDFSSSATAALLYAQRLVRSEMIALYCSTEKEMEHAEGWLERLRFLAPLNESHTVPVQHIVEAGEPGFLIRTMAGKLRPDLIVLGAPSGEFADSEPAGSTVCEVVEHALCPVLLIPAHLDKPEMGFGS